MKSRECWKATVFIVLAYHLCSICVPLNISWFHKSHDLMTFTPAWAFLVFPLMLIGVVASRVLSVMPLDSPQAVPVWFLGQLLYTHAHPRNTFSQFHRSRAGYMFQGLGTCMTFFYMVRGFSSILYPKSVQVSHIICFSAPLSPLSELPSSI